MCVKVIKGGGEHNEAFCVGIHWKLFASSAQPEVGVRATALLVMKVQERPAFEVKAGATTDQR